MRWCYKCIAWKKIIPADKKVVLTELPFTAGEKVEILILRRAPAGEAVYALREQPVEYEKPFESVAEANWEALK